MFTWATNNSSISNLWRDGKTSTDGLITWNSSYGVSTTKARPILPAAESLSDQQRARRSFTVSYFQNGQVQSVTRKDSAGNQLGNTSYAYILTEGNMQSRTPAMARRHTVSINGRPRDGVRTPSPELVKNAQTTSYSYDSMGPHHPHWPR